ncbi:hypothetical protein AWH48_11920 [Domibacillus aminovorans]|uniref:DUF3221 domain-containing protein n=1 Tax=Domibacillus aminovorans TaxID=29332 RepID=A0A177KI67_9BACI|nr:hypothetical protein [Domibacillus aminovorans]OAH53059.1 hypothetical protein AWH48_11920 [Domibacillus aminovorans]
MKILSVLLVLLIGLAACSQEEGDKLVEVVKRSGEMQEAPADKYILTSDIGEIEILGLYEKIVLHEKKNSSEEDGSCLIDFEGFHLKTTPTLVKVRPNEMNMEMFGGQEEIQAIMLTQSAENTTDGDVDYLGTTTIITDTKEQISEPSGLMSTNAVVQTYYGKVQAEGFSLFPLKDSKVTPQKIAIMFEPPYKIVNGAVDGTRLGEGQRVDFIYTDREELE